MAGVMMEGDYGQEVKKQTVPTIGGAEYRASIGLAPSEQTVPEAASAHYTDANRAEGVAYPETQGIAVTSKAYPSGTAMKDTTPGDHAN